MHFKQQTSKSKESEEHLEKADISSFRERITVENLFK